MKRSDEAVTVEAGSPAYGGLAVGRVGGKAVLIKGAIPGETVVIRKEQEKRDFSIAIVEHVLAASPERVEALCGLFGRCGGCHLQYVSHTGQVRLKEEVLRDCLARIGKIRTDLSPSLVSASPWHYRHRGQFKVHGGSLGFYMGRSRELVTVTYCPLMVEGINEQIRSVGEPLHGLSRLHPSLAGEGEVHILCGDAPHALVRFPRKAPAGRALDELLRMFLQHGFAGVTVAVRDVPVAARGVPHCTLPLDGLSYTVSPLSFFQGNWALNRRVIEYVRTFLRPLGSKRVLDLFSGAGNFSLPLAVESKEVIAVEENPHAVRDGERNARFNGIDNCTFIGASAEGFRNETPVDVVVVDPPRSGLTDRAAGNVMGWAPERIVYLSCNPATLARDLRKLSGLYSIESIQMIDFFPQTFHIEALVFLSSR